jgi:single-strand DNA-binding protein
MRYLPDGTAVTNLSVACNRRWTDGDGNAKSQVTWLRVSVWGRQAETCNEFLTKGSKVLVEGELSPDESGNPKTFTRRDGTAGASYEVRGSRVLFLDARGESDTPAAAAAAVVEEDEIPF